VNPYNKIHYSDEQYTAGEDCETGEEPWRMVVTMNGFPESMRRMVVTVRERSNDWLNGCATY
jgi:hypothetical protein